MTSQSGCYSAINVVASEPLCGEYGDLDNLCFGSCNSVWQKKMLLHYQNFLDRTTDRISFLHTGRFYHEGRAVYRSTVAAICFVLAAVCSWTEVRAGDNQAALPRLEHDAVIATDGYRLPISKWLPDGEPCRVVLGLHGFNDYRKTFDTLAGTLSEDCTAFYAYDQRGFGGTDNRGLWAGRARLVNDVGIVASLLHDRHPGIPLYLAGESMGGAVAILALAQETPPPVAGAVLMAPAVWAWEIQPWHQRVSLWLGVRLMPGVRLSSEWIDIDPSDDLDVLEYWRSHPMVIQKTRIAALYGVTSLMDAALSAAGELKIPALILYGGKDEVIPPEATCAMLRTLPEDRDNWRFVYYLDGYHMLARYSGATTTIKDIRAWLESPDAALPSGRELKSAQAKDRLCR